ncbi:MAG: dephospho-CoA kinase [Candidatus Omnitrophica bacterium]|nr:dephospho-CoA kinase [Candidatus Omnitrophota bacterium]
MTTVAVTGSVGTGKSTVSRMFERLGAQRINADALAREAIEKDRPPYRRVVRYFGKTILRKGGSIDRGHLAQIVFKNEKKLKVLNCLVHPYVLRRMKEEIRRIRRKKRGAYIVVEVPLLHEKRLEKMFDQVLTVSCRRPIQRKRWLKRGGSLKELRGRLAAQLPLSYKGSHSDFIIDNNGSVRETKAQVVAFWKTLAPPSRRPGRASRLD